MKIQVLKDDGTVLVSGDIVKETEKTDMLFAQYRIMDRMDTHRLFRPADKAQSGITLWKNEVLKRLALPEAFEPLDLFTMPYSEREITYRTLYDGNRLSKAYKMNATAGFKAAGGTIPFSVLMSIIEEINAASVRGDINGCNIRLTTPMATDPSRLFGYLFACTGNYETDAYTVDLPKGDMKRVMAAVNNPTTTITLLLTISISSAADIKSKRGEFNE